MVSQRAPYPFPSLLLVNKYLFDLSGALVSFTSAKYYFNMNKNQPKKFKNRRSIGSLLVKLAQSDKKLVNSSISGRQIVPFPEAKAPPFSPSTPASIQQKEHLKREFSKQEPEEKQQQSAEKVVKNENTR